MDFGEDVDVYNENKEYIGEEPAAAPTYAYRHKHMSLFIYLIP